jgi:hypothetical protein
MNNTEKTLITEKIYPKKEVLENLKSFARSYKMGFSKTLNRNVEWVVN